MVQCSWYCEWNVRQAWALERWPSWNWTEFDCRFEDDSVVCSVVIDAVAREMDTSDPNVERVRVMYRGVACPVFDSVLPIMPTPSPVVSKRRVRCRSYRRRDHECAAYDDESRRLWHLIWCSSCPWEWWRSRSRSEVERRTGVDDGTDALAVAAEEEPSRFDRIVSAVEGRFQR